MAGWQGFAEHVERGVAVIAQVRERLVGRGWTVANDSSLAVLCVEPPQGDREFVTSCAAPSSPGEPGWHDRRLRDVK